MVYEAYPLITDNLTFNISESCDETCYLDSITPVALRVEIINAVVSINKLVNTVNVSQNIVVLQDQEKRKADALKIDLINKNISTLGYAWKAGDNDIVKSYYAQKKNRWGEKYNLLGYDYYAGGIYMAAGVEYATITSNPYVDYWDWRNRHHANDPASPYYDGDLLENTGWLTSIKNQSEPPGCGSCSAFGTFGSFEALINLYYNQHLDFDLSEQEQLSCNPQVDCGGGHPNTIFPYIRDYNVVTEECFPYQANDQLPCDKCENPDPELTLANYEEHSEGNF